MPADEDRGATGRPALRTLAAILPEGIDPPADIPADIFEAAMTTYMDCRRLDMGQLAAELGMSRPTLWRKAGSRDRLLGEVLWQRTRLGIADALASAGRRSGSARVLFVVEHLMRRFATQPSLRRFLDAEPEIALRVLTSKTGPVERGVVGALERMLRAEQERGMVLSIDPAVLAYAVVRIAESFQYADVIADQEPDLDQAMEIIGSLLRGHAVDPSG